MQDLSISEKNQSSYREAYLDNAATTKPRPEVVQVMMRELRNYGNASSVHALGKKAKRVLEDSRAVVAAALGAESDEVFSHRAEPNRTTLPFAVRLWRAESAQVES